MKVVFCFSVVLEFTYDSIYLYVDSLIFGLKKVAYETNFLPMSSRYISEFSVLVEMMSRRHEQVWRCVVGSHDEACVDHLTTGVRGDSTGKHPSPGHIPIV